MASEFEQARATRLAYLMQSPGWPDLLAILAELDAEATEALHSFAGWDRERKCDLMARMQATHGMRLEIIRRVQNNILAATQSDVLDNKAEAEHKQLSDDELEQLIETRIPGTY